MARFITVHQQQAIIQEQSHFIHYLLLVVIVMEFIPLPVLPGFGIAPINIMLFFSGLVILFNLKELPNLSPIVVKMILLLFFFDVYDYIVSWALGLEKKEVFFPMATTRKCIELLFFALACIKPAELKRALFTITGAIIVSALFGLLIYHVGEPFQGIRDWLLQDTDVKSGVSGKGLWISGLSGQHFLFGYLIGVAPVVALVCSQISRFRWLWFGVFVLLAYTLYLNAERAALLSAIIGVVYLLMRWRLLNTLYICIGLSFFLTAYMLKPSSQMITEQDSVQGASLASRFVKTDAGTEERLDWLKAGVMSVLDHPFTGVKDQEYISSFFDRHIVVIDSPDRKVPYAHNHYANTGLRIGILGWVILFFYLSALKDIFKQVFTTPIKNRELKIIAEGVAVSLFSVMTVALFHNNGIFFNESVTVCLTGLLISIYQNLLYTHKTLDSFDADMNK